MKRKFISLIVAAVVLTTMIACETMQPIQLHLLLILNINRCFDALIKQKA